MVAAWAEKNSSNQYDIYYQKFDQQGNKLGKALLFTDENGGNTISNLPTNEFTFEKVIGSSLLVRTSTGDASLIIRDNNVKHGLKFLQLGDGSYVTAWEEIQDSTSVGVGYQRFDSEGNALASELISHTTPRPITTSYLQNPSTSILTIEAGQGINDFTINLNSYGDGDKFSISSVGEKNKLYKTESGSYILDFAGSKVGDVPDAPIILVNEKVFRGVVSQSLYSFKYEPTGSVANENGGGTVYYQDTRGNWFKDSFNERGVFEETSSLTISELLNDETKYSIDLNNDDSVGDTITSVLVDSGNLGVYRTVSNSFIIDNSGLGIGDSSVSPTLLVSQKVYRGKTTTSLYDFNDTPTGALSFKDGSGVGVYYQDSRGATWKRDSFDNDGVFQVTDSLTISEVLNDEAVYDLDLDGNGKIGDTISNEIQSSSKFDFTVKYSLKHDYEYDGPFDWQPEFTINPSNGLIYSNANFLNANGNEYTFEVNAETSDGNQFKKDFTIKIKNEDLKLSSFATESKESLHEPFTVLSKNKDEFILGYLSLDDAWTGVSAQVFDLEGKAKTLPFQINTNENGKQQDLKIINISDGLYAAAYSSGAGGYSAIDSNYGGVALQLFKNDGTLIGSEQRVNDNTLKNEQLSAITSLDNGNFVISYYSERGYNQEFNPHDRQKYFQIYSSEGTRIGNNIEITDSGGGDRSFILSKNDGGFSIVSERAEWVTLSNGYNSFKGKHTKSLTTMLKETLLIKKTYQLIVILVAC